MIVNNLKYLNKEEYENFAYTLENRKACRNKVKNIVILKNYTNVEFINYIYQELGLDRKFLENEENQYHGLYDYFTDIARIWLSEEIRIINLLIEKKDYLTEKMYEILERLQNYCANGVLTIGSIYSFPLSLDIYIQKNENEENRLKKSLKKLV